MSPAKSHGVAERILELVNIYGFAIIKRYVVK